MVAAHAFRTVPIESQAPDRGGAFTRPPWGGQARVAATRLPFFKKVMKMTQKKFLGQCVALDDFAAQNALAAEQPVPA